MRDNTKSLDKELYQSFFYREIFHVLLKFDFIHNF